MTGIDWPGLMRAGLQGLGLAPDAFWKLTPGELRLRLGVDRADAPLSRQGLEALARLFPDGKGDRDG